MGRDAVMAAMHRRGIGTGVHYIALHLHPYYRKRYGLSPRDFPNATWISERTISLPLSAKLTDAEVSRVADSFRKIVGGAARRRG